MAINPHTVVSPKRPLTGLRVICITHTWSLAVGMWDGPNRALLLHWNGDAGHLLGNPA